MRSHKHLPTELGDAFTVSQALTFGFSSMRLIRDGLERPIRGVYVRSNAFDALHPAARPRARHRAIALAFASTLSPYFWLSHETAAAVWGLPVPISPEQPIVVASATGSRRVTRVGVTHRVMSEHLAEARLHLDVRVASPTATWAMVAPQLSWHDAIALGDAILHRPRIAGTQRLERPPLATREELLASVHAHHRRHQPRLNALIDEVSPHCASAPESHLRLFLHEIGYAPESLDLDIRDHQGRFVGCTEFAYPSVGILVEYEGDHHRTDKRQWNRDIEKYAAYAALGWQVVRVTAEMLYQRPTWLRRHMREIFQSRFGLRPLVEAEQSANAPQ